MKPIFFLKVILLCCLYACEQTGSKTILSESPPIVEETRVDTIFLGYRFGMSKAEFTEHTKKLLKKGVLYDKSGKVTYNLIADQEIVYPTVFSPEYLENKLWKLSLSATSDNPLFDSPSFISANLAMLFLKKYGRMSKEESSTIDSDCSDYTWEKGNLMVEVRCGFNDARIFYTDSSMANQSDSIKQRQIENTLDDI